MFLFTLQNLEGSKPLPCLPSSPVPPVFNTVGMIVASSNTRIQSFYYQNGQLTHKILIKPKNGHIKYKVPGSQP